MGAGSSRAPPIRAGQIEARREHNARVVQYLGRGDTEEQRRARDLRAEKRNKRRAAVEEAAEAAEAAVDRRRRRRVKRKRRPRAPSWTYTGRDTDFGDWEDHQFRIQWPPTREALRILPTYIKSRWGGEEVELLKHEMRRDEDEPRIVGRVIVLRDGAPHTIVAETDYWDTNRFAVLW